MLLSSSDIRSAIESHGLISPVSEIRKGRIEGCSFDLRLGDVEKRDIMSNPCIITEGYRKMPGYTQLSLNEHGMWTLAPYHRYKLTSQEEVFMPDNVWAQVLLRRTFPECGLLHFSTGITPGYKGTISTIVYNVDHFPVELGGGAEFCTVVFQWISEGETDPYDGPRQGNKKLEGKVRPR